MIEVAKVLGWSNDKPDPADPKYPRRNRTHREKEIGYIDLEPFDVDDAIRILIKAKQFAGSDKHIVARSSVYDGECHGLGIVVYWSEEESMHAYEQRCHAYELQKKEEAKDKEQKERELYERLHKKYGEEA